MITTRNSLLVTIGIISMLLVSCSGDTGLVDTQMGSQSSSKKTESAYIAAAEEFIMEFCLPIPCPRQDCKNCGKIKKPGASAQAELDYAISQGPTSVDAYFTSTTNQRDSMFLDIEVNEATLYSQLTSGNYWMLKQTEYHGGGWKDVYYIGNHSTQSPSNATSTVIMD